MEKKPMENTEITSAHSLESNEGQWYAGLKNRYRRIRTALSLAAAPAVVIGAIAAAGQVNCSLNRLGTLAEGGTGGTGAEGGVGGTGGTGAKGGVGGSGGTGLEAGSGGTGGTCVPTDEECNGKDDDCDGEDDNGVTPPDCLEPNQGACEDATDNRVCNGVNGWSECDYGPNYESNNETQCDGVDNDCDGFTDEISDLENYKPACANTQGVCTGVEATCNGANGWECDYGLDYEPVTELTCDTLDNNCNGATDEGCVTLHSTTCHKIGVFANSGSTTFEAGSSNNDINCETAEVTFMSSSGNRIYVWVRDTDNFTITTDVQWSCKSDCSLYLNPPAHAEILNDLSSLGWTDNAAENQNGNDWTYTNDQKVCSRDVFRCDRP
jgi:hypothetical protein